MEKDYQIILFDKLNRFINKYYKNEILKGVIFLIAALLFFLLLFSLIEYFSRFNSNLRSLLFWGYIIINIVISVQFVLIPLFHLFRIGKVINYTDAAAIIGRHFPEIDDKILNILQLNELSQENHGLINASIQQKTKNIQPFSFRSIINFKENRKHLKWILIPAFIFLFFIFSGNQHIITESSARIIDYENEYTPPLPFQFNISNTKLEVIQQEDFQLTLEITGKKIPSKVYIEIKDNKFSLVKDNINHYHYLFKNVISDIKFRFFAEGYYSQYYNLRSLLKPDVLGFNILLDFPSYTNIKDEKLENIGDLLVPEGTRICWDFNMKNTNYLGFTFNNLFEEFKVKNNMVNIKKSAFSGGLYSIFTYNNHVFSDTTYYTVRVIKDEYPKIDLEKTLDSVNNVVFFNGTISDDYSLSKLVFNYTVKKEDSSISYNEKINIHNLSHENFYHFININAILNPGDQITYYFEVWDNDKINGNKSTKSVIVTHQEPSKEELQQKRDKESSKIKGGLNETIRLAEDIQKDINELKKSLIDKQNLGWEEKKKAENIIKKQKKLESLIKENNKQNNIKNKSQEKLSSSILEKQKKLEDLMNRVLDEESKKLMEDLLKLFEETEKEKIKDVLDKLEKNNSDLEKELDRNLELYKELEFEQKLEDVINKIDELKEKQEQLKHKTEEKTSDAEELAKDQEKLQEELDDLQKNLEKLKEQNSSLENKKDLPNITEETKETSSSMEESKKSLQQKQKNKSSKKQQETIESLEKMSEKMKGLQNTCSNEQPSEDMETLRQILENLITLSFQEEELIHSISNLPKNSSSIVKYIQMQKKLSDDAKIIEDSLLALSKRVIQMESIINKEISSINYNIEKSISFLEERKINVGVASQQFVMTSLNNLALLLSETLKQMQMDIANKTPGSKQCNKPGSSSTPSLKELKKMQQNLMEEMKGKMGKQGKEKGEKLSEKQSQKLMNLANQQQQIRLRLLELRDEIGENGDKGNIDKILEKMEENEIDILNNNITNETILRQQEILTKLLEAEESQRERGEEEKRESIEWDYEIKNDNSEYLEYIENKRKQEELLKTTPIQLNKFFKEKVNKYFNNISEEN